jgi:hypothetical protein
MRDNGLDAKAALNVLRYHIEVLSKPDREALAVMMRNREANAGTGASAPATSTSAPAAQTPAPAMPTTPPEASAPSSAARPKTINSIKPLSTPVSDAPNGNPAVTIKPNVPDFGAPAAESAEDVVWVNCLHCGKTNQRHEVFCYSCGQLLEPVKGAGDTRVLGEPTAEPLDNEHFSNDSVLVLRVRGSTENYETRPQNSDHEIIIGRSTKGSVLAPDIDLTNKQASDLGVSRLHLSIRYDAEHAAVLIADLGSANGSFINGQRMMPKEVRVLRHGDELRLGKLVLLASFRHP